MKDTLLKIALLGVDRAAMQPIDGEIGVLIAQLSDGGDPARDFSRATGVFAACERAAARLSASHATPPPAAAPDARAMAADHPWVPVLTWAFAQASLASSHEAQLRYEACSRMAAIDARLPALLLPAALDAGRRDVALRPALLPVLGTRGRWLAAFNPDWSYAEATAAGDISATVWQDGGAVDRQTYFATLRRTDAAAARALLQADLGQMAAKERAEFVALLTPELSDDDRPLLEPLLRDRSREVRQLAASMLARLPDSAHARQLIAWLAPLLTQKRGLLARGWSIEAPEQADSAWTSAAIEATRPQHDVLGERAWWLYQLVRQVPLAWWSTHTGMNAAALVAWAAKTDWKDALYRGWRERVSAAEPDWVEALLAVREQEMRQHAAELLSLLPATRREAFWPTDLAELSRLGIVGDVIGAYNRGETFSLAYSRPLIAGLLRCFEDDRLRHDHVLRNQLLDLAVLLHPQSLTAMRSIERRADETPAMAECAETFQRIVQARIVLHATP